MFKCNFKAWLICIGMCAKLRKSAVCSLFYFFFILNLKFTDIMRRFYFVLYSFVEKFIQFLC